MLTALTPEDGLAGYVAIERVTGTLHGRSGSLVLQHSEIMTKGVQSVAIDRPGSGTDKLLRIQGEFRLTIERQHFYELDYTLA